MKPSFGIFRTMFHRPSQISLPDCACVCCRQRMPVGYSVLPLITDIPCRHEKLKIFVLYQGCVYETICCFRLMPLLKRACQLLTCTSRVEPFKNTGTYLRILFPIVQQPLVGLGLLIIETPRSHSDTPHSVGLHWTSEVVAETST
jgi:hypothetical protein